MDRHKLKQALALLLAIVRNPQTPGCIQAQLGEVVVLLQGAMDENP